MPARSRRASRSVSAAYVLSVVKPPRKPVARKGRTSGGACHTSMKSTTTTPMAAQPATFTVKVAHGKPSGGAAQARSTAYRAAAPSAPPSATTATVGRSERTLARRSRAATSMSVGSSRSPSWEGGAGEAEGRTG
ncbi:hypothetical protein GA0115246_108188, partial [Streptomyces sp. SolWspMP-sol7th]